MTADSGKIAALRRVVMVAVNPDGIQSLFTSAQAQFPEHLPGLYISYLIPRCFPRIADITQEDNDVRSQNIHFPGESLYLLQPGIVMDMEVANRYYCFHCPLLSPRTYSYSRSDILMTFYGDTLHPRNNKMSQYLVREVK
jgi:hypothetical protein